ncbi:MAG: hypothetical protein R6U64_03430 [Bacteroidales bacterium]
MDSMAVQSVKKSHLETGLRIGQAESIRSLPLNASHAIEIQPYIS